MVKNTEQKRRDILNEYTHLSAELEIAHMCISILERITNSVGQPMVKKLQTHNQKLLVKIDKLAAKLGAPYPGTNFKEEG